jgi:predicted DsbA family dithiol-disulfide isomerase
VRVVGSGADGLQYAVSGAQGEETFLEIFRKLATETSSL